MEAEKMTITEKVAYIKGLAEGLNFGEDTKESKLFNAIIDVLDDMALTVADLVDQTDAIDEDLDSLEEYVYEDDYCDGDCENCDGCDDDDFDDDEDEDDYYEFECPNCHKTVHFDDSLFEQDDYTFVCPECGAVLENIFEEDNDDE